MQRNPTVSNGIRQNPTAYKTHSVTFAVLFHNCFGLVKQGVVGIAVVHQKYGKRKKTLPDTFLKPAKKEYEYD